MSDVLGIPDFKDFLESEDYSYIKKITIYIGYYNYLMDIPLDTSSYKDIKDWAELYHYTIIAKSLYKNLNEGYVVLDDRDYISIQQDKNTANGYNELAKKLNKMRLKYKEELTSIGFPNDEAEVISAYRPELEGVSYEPDV